MAHDRGRISPAAADTMLGIHGPLGLLSILGVLSAGVIACYAGFSQLGPRAGSPPSAGALLERSGGRGGWRELDEYLHEGRSPGQAR